jgi:6-hydroxycyclohex-1-ene-1-carbonyl-CoA dehydrogenase
MVLAEREEQAGPGEVIVEVAGCGVCHTDLGYFYEGVPTRHAFPLVLGHEISGRVVETGSGAESWSGRSVVVPAVIPCGSCPACRAGRGAVCPKQIFPGNDVHGGFATHVRVPAHGLCPVPEGADLVALSVIADAVSTPYQAIARSGLAEGDVAVFVGAGGVGGFGVQVAAALGAHVIALDVDDAKLAPLREFGAAATLDVAAVEFKEIRKQVRRFADERGVPTWRTKIFETSGTPAGQSTAFGLLGHGGWLGIVGFTPKPVEVRLSNLMAFDAVAQGTWGCAPELYPEIVRLVVDGRIALEPFVERRPLASVNTTFEDLHARRVSRRVILVPEA